jgi:SAM-dependent methyltransferase
MEQLEGLQRTAELVALLRAAERSGLLRSLAAPSTSDALAARLGVTPARLDAVLGLLRAHGVAEPSDGSWVLTEAWSPLVLGQTPVCFDGFLGLGRVRAEQFEASLSGGHDYWQLDEADRLLVARGISPDPASPATVAMARGDIVGLEGVVAALDAGGRALELGCGLGSRLCALLQAFPAATAVGVELTADLVAAGRRRAEQLGVADRITYVVSDAAASQPDGCFDLVGWSQFFFPEQTRAAALATARRALRPGGWVTMPVIWDGVAPPAGSALERDLAAERLVLDLWQVPLRTTTEVSREVEEAGFVEVRVDDGPVVSFVRGRQPH